MNLPRGKYIGKRVGQPATDEAEHFIRCPACDGWIDCAISAKCSSTKSLCHTLRRINRNDGHSIRSV
jgi:hypothetical protein